MFEADFSKTERRALLDETDADLVEFARRTIDWAREHGYGEIVWHFAALSSVAYLDRASGLTRVAGALRRSRETTVDGVRIIVETRRTGHQGGGSFAPLAAWWPDDEQLLRLDSTHRPFLDAIVSATSRAPIWLTAFIIDMPEPVGVVGSGSMPGDEERVTPIVVSPEVQNTIAARSKGMTLSSNGIHDSLGPLLLADARQMLRAGQTTTEAIAVAALRAGWWPEKIPALLDKL